MRPVNQQWEPIIVFDAEIVIYDQPVNACGDVFNGEIVFSMTASFFSKSVMISPGDLCFGRRVGNIIGAGVMHAIS